MLQLSRWKTILVVLSTLFGILFTAPNLLPTSVTDGLPGWAKQRLNLGLDLQGGSYLLLEVDTSALQRETLGNLIEDVRRSLTQAKIPFSGLGQAGGAVRVQITDPAQASQAQTELQKLVQPLAGAAGGVDMLVTRNGALVTLTPVAEAQTAAAASAVKQSIEIIRRRVDELGTREPTIIQQGANRIVVQAPGESDPERLRKVIGQTAKLTFQMVDESVPADQIAAGRIPPQSALLPYDNPADGAGVLVQRRILVAGEMLVGASAGFDQFGKSVVNFRFDGQGARRFGDATRANVGKRFAIILDGKVISAPTINEPITGGSGQISGNFTTETANDLSVLLRAGALPAPLKVEQQQTVGAELGADAVKGGKLSFLVGFLAVVVFMILAYGWLFGGISVLALVVNGLLIVAAMSVTQATLTLPGIAGLILTLAVAIDANVLIYERMREEYKAGRPLISAMDAGFNRAMLTIIDANVTALAAGAIMFVFGAGPVRGFAWTLSIGVFTSVFTAVFVTQLCLAIWLRAARPKKLPIV
jgi:preprotein translocase subunit SecD